MFSLFKKQNVFKILVLPQKKTHYFYVANYFAFYVLTTLCLCEADEKQGDI